MRPWHTAQGNFYTYGVLLTARVVFVNVHAPTPRTRAPPWVPTKTSPTANFSEQTNQTGAADCAINKNKQQHVTP